MSLILERKTAIISLSDYNEKIYPLLYKKEDETSGWLTQDKSGIYHLGGTERGYYKETPVVESEISFHTHPKSIYVSMQCKYGWPSGCDYKMFGVGLLLGNYLHLVFALEGIYYIRYRKRFIKLFIRLKPKEREVLLDLIESHLTKTEQFRHISNSNLSILDEYLKVINSLTLFMVINTHPDKKISGISETQNDFNLLSVKLSKERRESMDYYRIVI